MLTDTHSHIHFLREFPDTKNVIENALNADVSRQIIVGCTPKDSLQALRFVKEFGGGKMFATLGVHPHNANECDEYTLKRFKELVLAEPSIVGFGEMGLDYFRNLQPKLIQFDAFKKQLMLAKELDKACVVHVRDAWEDALKVLGEIGHTRIVLHCFTGTLEIAKKCWERGYYTSFSGVITYPKNDYLREVVLEAPEDKILVETDCPYLPPQKYRGKRNEPAFIVETAMQISHTRGDDYEKVCEYTSNNAATVFGLE